MPDWQMRRLGDLIDVRGGLSYKSKYIDSGDAKLLGMGCVSFSQRFLQNGCRSYAGKYTEKHLVEEGDLVIATRQQSDNLPILGFPAMIPSGISGTDIIVGTNLYKVDNFSNFSNSFLFWLMRGEGYRSHVKACASGSTVRMITKDVILDYCFDCPSERESEAIATVLDRIEDKIELNQKMNQTLEDIAKAIFKSWFVDFDPVRAKMEGRPTGLPPEIDELFPDELVDSEIGVIPKEWRVVPLSKCGIEIESGRRPKGGIDKSLDDGIPSVGAESIAPAGEFDFSKVKYITPEFAEKMKKGRVQDFDVALYKDGGKPGQFIPRVAIYGGGFPFEHFYVNEHVFLLRAEHLGQPFLYRLVSSDGFLDQLIAKGSSKAAQPGLNQPEVIESTLVLPSKEVISAFNSKTRSLLERQFLLGKENGILSQLRDTLLPKLISGELRIPDAEKFLEEAGI